MSTQVGRICTPPSRILLATDLTELNHLLPIAIRYTRKRKATLQLIHVLTEASASRNAEETLEQAAKKTREEGLKCTWIICNGAVAEAIEQCARQWKADRLIIGTHGPRKFDQKLLGSVAESIFREVDVPVLAIGPAVQHYDEPSFRKPRILLATALDRESRAVADSVLHFARLHRADLTLLHVIPDIAKAHPAASRVCAYAEQIFQEILSGFQADISRPSCVIERGQVAETILRVAKRGHYDLIFLGAVSGYSFRTEVMPGTAYGVICRASCPVMVIKEGVHGAVEALPKAL